MPKPAKTTAAEKFHSFRIFAAGFPERERLLPFPGLPDFRKTSVMIRGNSKGAELPTGFQSRLQELSFESSEWPPPTQASAKGALRAHRKRDK